MVCRELAPASSTPSQSYKRSRLHDTLTQTVRKTIRKSFAPQHQQVAMSKKEEREKVEREAAAKKAADEWAATQKATKELSERRKVCGLGVVSRAACLCPRVYVFQPRDKGALNRMTAPARTPVAFTSRANQPRAAPPPSTHHHPHTHAGCCCCWPRGARSL